MLNIGKKSIFPINKGMKDYILKSTYESINCTVEKNKDKHQYKNYNIDLNNSNNLNEVITYPYKTNLNPFIYFLSISTFWFLYSHRK